MRTGCAGGGEECTGRLALCCVPRRREGIRREIGRWLAAAFGGGAEEHFADGVIIHLGHGFDDLRELIGLGDGCDLAAHLSAPGLGGLAGTRGGIGESFETVGGAGWFGGTIPARQGIDRGGIGTEWAHAADGGILGMGARVGVRVRGLVACLAGGCGGRDGGRARAVGRAGDSEEEAGDGVDESALAEVVHG